MIKISLDGSAIDKLCKDDPDLIVDLKRGVLENFTNKHIKSLLNIEEIKKAIYDVKLANSQASEAIELSIQKEIEKQIGVVTSNSWGKVTTVRLAKDIEDQISRVASIIIEKNIYEIFTRETQKALDKTINNIQRIIDIRLTENLNSLVDSEVRKRLELAKNIK